jgi:hypothetical protein
MENFFAYHAYAQKVAATNVKRSNNMCKKEQQQTWIGTSEEEQ